LIVEDRRGSFRECMFIQGYPNFAQKRVVSGDGAEGKADIREKENNFPTRGSLEWGIWGETTGFGGGPSFKERPENEAGTAFIKRKGHLIPGQDKLSLEDYLIPRKRVWLYLYRGGEKKGPMLYNPGGGGVFMRGKGKTKKGSVVRGREARQRVESPPGEGKKHGQPLAHVREKNFLSEKRREIDRPDRKFFITVEDPGGKFQISWEYRKKSNIFGGNLFGEKKRKGLRCCKGDLWSGGLRREKKVSTLARLVLTWVHRRRKSWRKEKRGGSGEGHLIS